MFDHVLIFWCIVIRSCSQLHACGYFLDEIEFPTCDSHHIPCFVVAQVTFYFIYNLDVDGISELLRYGLLEVLLWYLFCLHSLSDCVSSSSIWNTSPRNWYSVPSWLESLEGYIHTYYSNHNIGTLSHILLLLLWGVEYVRRKFKNVAWASH